MALNKPKQDIVVVYDCKGKLKSKEFTDMFAARRFFTAKDKAGCNPTLQITKRN
jgi:hypothetical protein